MPRPKLCQIALFQTFHAIVAFFSLTLTIFMVYSNCSTRVAWRVLSPTNYRSNGGKGRNDMPCQKL